MHFSSLLEGAPDEKLAEALTFLFGRYGTVFVKIKRKANNMPYAFVQFTVSRNRVYYPLLGLTDP